MLKLKTLNPFLFSIIIQSEIRQKNEVTQKPLQMTRFCFPVVLNILSLKEQLKGKGTEVKKRKRETTQTAWTLVVFQFTK